MSELAVSELVKKLFTPPKNSNNLLSAPAVESHYPLNMYAGAHVIVGQFTGAGAEGLTKIIHNKIKNLEGINSQKSLGKLVTQSHEDWHNHRDEAIARSRNWMAKLDADITIWGEYYKADNKVILNFTPFEQTSNTIGDLSIEDALEFYLPLSDFDVEMIHLALLVGVRSYYSSQQVYLRSILAQQAETVEDLLQNSMPSHYTREQQFAVFSLLSTAYASLGKSGDATWYFIACEIIERADIIANKETSPAMWLIHKNRLASLHMIIGEDEKDPSFLEKAADAWQDIGTSLDQYVYPLDYAMAWMKAGTAMQRLGRLNGHIDILRSGFNAINFALNVFTQDEYPNMWIESTLQQGLILLDISNLAIKRKNFDSALNTFFKVLDFIKLDTRGKDELIAQTYNNIGSVYFTIAKRYESESTELLEAEKYFKLALTILDGLGRRQTAKTTRRNIFKVQQLKNVRFK